jgi:Na+/glutamate symporter
LIPGIANYNDIIQRIPKLEEQLQQSNITTTIPLYIPPLFVNSIVQWINVSCDIPARMIDALSLAMQIQHTSDIALTSLLAMALDFGP